MAVIPEITFLRRDITLRVAYNNDALHSVLQREYRIRIAVCDDERHIRSIIKDTVTAYSVERQVEVDIDEYECGEDLIKASHEYSIVILDYMMDGMNGLQAAKTLRNNNNNCQIIFLTCFPQFVYDSFEVSTFRFFEKPLDANDLYKALDNYFELFGNDYPLMLSVGRDTVCIQTNAIVYIEADNKKCYINLAEDTMHCTMSMAAVAQIIPDSIFYKVNKSFIINFNYISNYNNDFIYFSNGKFVPVSRRYLASFKDAFQNYAKGRVI